MKNFLVIGFLIIILQLGIKLIGGQENKRPYFRQDNSKWLDQRMNISLSSLLSEENNVVGTPFITNRFHCPNSTFEQFLPDGIKMMTHSKIPQDFACVNVNLPKRYFVNSIGNHFDSIIPIPPTATNEDENICVRISKWEQSYGISCSKLLCEWSYGMDNSTSVADWIYLRTYNQSSLVEWINYCKYCGNSLLSLNQYEEINGRCNPKDRAVLNIMEEFPNYIYYCGSSTIGLPFIVEKSQFIGKFSFPTYSYWCYCPNFDSISWTCEFMHSLMSSVPAMLAHTVAAFMVFFIVLLPKVAKLVKMRKIGELFTIVLILFSPIFFILSLILPGLVSFGSYYLKLFQPLSLLWGISSIFSWLLTFYGFVSKIRNRKQIIPKIIGFIFYIFVILISIAFFLCWIFTGNNSLDVLIYLYAVGTMTICCLTLVGLVIISIVIYFDLKHMSEVNIFSTSVSNTIH